jgi:hypothetical protein
MVRDQVSTVGVRRGGADFLCTKLGIFGRWQHEWRVSSHQRVGGAEEIL